MIRYDDVEQQTDDWFALKWGKIGGTANKGLFVNSDTLLIDLLSQRLEEFEPEDSFTSEDMQRGNDLEPFAREYLNEYTGLDFKETGWIQSEENELMGVSPDGITDCNTMACEIKCFGRKKHTSVLLNDAIPKEYVNQIIQYFAVNPKLEKLYWLAFRPEAPKHFIKEVTLETKFDIGNKRKPQIMSVEAIRDYSNEKANELLIKIKEKEEQLNF